jgi:two-component system LytT family response regulator
MMFNAIAFAGYIFIHDFYPLLISTRNLASVASICALLEIPFMVMLGLLSAKYGSKLLMGTNASTIGRLAPAFPGREDYPSSGFLTGGIPMQILLIDDNPHVRDSLKQMLEQLFLETADILEAGCDSSALRLIRRHMPGLIITDAKLLLLSEAIQLDQLYEQRTNGRIIVTSSHEFVLKAFSQGGIDSLLKPIGLEELELALLRTTDAGSDYDSSYLEQQQENAQSSQVM